MEESEIWKGRWKMRIDTFEGQEYEEIKVAPVNENLQQDRIRQEGSDIAGAMKLWVVSWATYKKKKKQPNMRAADDMSHVAATFQGDLKMQRTFSHEEKREHDHQLLWQKQNNVCPPLTLVIELRRVPK